MVIFQDKTTGWCFGTWFLWLSIQLGMSSSLTFTPSFFRGVQTINLKSSAILGYMTSIYQDLMTSTSILREKVGNWETNVETPTIKRRGLSYPKKCKWETLLGVCFGTWLWRWIHNRQSLMGRQDENYTLFLRDVYTRQRCNISVSDGEIPGNSVCVNIYI